MYVININTFLNTAKFYKAIISQDLSLFRGKQQSLAKKTDYVNFIIMLYILNRIEIDRQFCYKYINCNNVLCLPLQEGDHLSFN